VIYGVSTNNAEMNEYLKREDPVELTRLSYINARVLKNKRGNIIIISVGYKRPVFDIKTPFKPLKEENKDYNFSDRSFLSCRIYQSMKDAKANSGLPHDEGGIDKDNFETVAKKQVIPQGHHIAVKIMNYSAGEELVKENANDVSELSNAGKSKAIALRKGGVIYRYSNMLFLVFPNTISFELYSNTYRQNLVSSKNTLSENINRRIIHFIKNGESHDLRTYFRLSPVDGNWKATLEDLDKKIEGYFYDELFLNLYFPEIVAYTGNVVLKQFDGKWKFNEADFSQPVSIVLKNGSELNFTKYLLKMFDDSNYNFPPSTYSVFETLIAISN
jgi:hypothetical protein